MATSKILKFQGGALRYRGRAVTGNLGDPPSTRSLNGVPAPGGGSPNTPATGDTRC